MQQVWHLLCFGLIQLITPTSTNQCFGKAMQQVVPGGSLCVSAVRLPESFLYLVSSFMNLWREDRSKNQAFVQKNPVRRSLNGFQPGMRAVSDAVNTASQQKVTAFYSAWMENIMQPLWYFPTSGRAPRVSASWRNRHKQGTGLS